MHSQQLREALVRVIQDLGVEIYLLPSDGNWGVYFYQYRLIGISKDADCATLAHELAHHLWSPNRSEWIAERTAITVCHYFGVECKPVSLYVLYSPREIEIELAASATRSLASDIIEKVEAYA